MKTVFIHISKNAGTSIRNTAGNLIKDAGHRTAKSWVEEHGRCAPLFAVLRNPFDRVVSEYFYRRQRYLAGDRNAHLRNLSQSFNDWVVATYEKGEMRSKHYFDTHGVPYNHFNMIGDCLIWFLPQTLWLSDESGDLLADETLRYENLEDDWAQFCRQYGIDRPLLQHNVTTRDRNYRTYYTEHTREIICDYFRADLETFNYAFD